MPALRLNLFDAARVISGGSSLVLPSAMRSSADSLNFTDYPPGTATITHNGWTFNLTNVGRQSVSPYLRFDFSATCPAANSSLEVFLSALSYLSPLETPVFSRVTVLSKTGGWSTVQAYGALGLNNENYDLSGGTAGVATLNNTGVNTSNGNGLVTPAVGPFSLFFLSYFAGTSAGTVTGSVEIV